MYITEHPPTLHHHGQSFMPSPTRHVEQVCQTEDYLMDHYLMSQLGIDPSQPAYMHRLNLYMQQKQQLGGL
jgi:hypothetical protein